MPFCLKVGEKDRRVIEHHKDDGATTDDVQSKRSVSFLHQGPGFGVIFYSSDTDKIIWPSTEGSCNTDRPSGIAAACRWQTGTGGCPLSGLSLSAYNGC